MMNKKIVFVAGILMVLGIVVCLAFLLGYSNFYEKDVKQNLVTTEKNAEKIDGIKNVQNDFNEGVVEPVSVLTTSDTAKQKLIDEMNETNSPIVKPSLEKIIPAVVYIECEGEGGGEMTSSGSGISFYSDDGQHLISTNAHVVRSYDDSIGGCWVYFPNSNGYFYDTAYWAGEVYMFDDKIVTIDEIPYGGNTYENGGLDHALLVLTEPGVDRDGASFPLIDETHFSDLYDISDVTCKHEELKIGDEIWVLGYPGVGGPNLTVTEGIISGFDGTFSEYIKTSAKVEHGNSGGIAIRVADGCLLGIPTQSMVGEMESISYILSNSFIGQFYDALNQTNAIDLSLAEDIQLPDEPLYDGLSWVKQENAYTKLLDIYSEMLTLTDVCVGYTAASCGVSRSIKLSNHGNHKLWTATKGPYKTTENVWNQDYADVVAYYDDLLKSHGFIRNDVVFIPDRKIAVSINDYAAVSDAFDGGTFRYARAQGTMIQFVVLDVNIFAHYTNVCTEGKTDCEIEVKEEYALFIGAQTSLDSFLTQEKNIQKFGLRLLLSQFASLMHSHSLQN